MSVQKGFREFRKSKNISRKALGEQLKVSDRTIENWEKGQTCPDADVLALLFEQYPELNLHWLITGVGEMLLGDEKNEQIEAYQKEIDELKTKVITLYGRLEGDGEGKK